MKEIIGGIAVALTFIAYIPYYRDILKGKTRPHIYSWSLWGLLTVLIVWHFKLKEVLVLQHG